MLGLQLLGSSLHERGVAFDYVELWAVGDIEDLLYFQSLVCLISLLGLEHLEVVHDQEEAQSLKVPRQLLHELDVMHGLA